MRSIGAILREIDAVTGSSLHPLLIAAAQSALQAELGQLLGVNVAAAPPALQGGIPAVQAGSVPADPPAAVPTSRGGKGG